MRSISLLTVCVVSLGVCAAGGGRAATLERVSVDSAGAAGEGDSFYPALSANGRFVAFVSRAPNLLPDEPADPSSDVFVHDRKTGRTECVSLDPDGVDANGQSSFPALSANGRFVAFESRASSLVPDDGNESSDVFVRDRKTGAIERISVDAAGAEGIGDSYEAAISANGRFVAFQSSVATLVPGDDNAADDVFVKDRKTGAIERVSVGSGGTQAHGGDSENPAISANGRYVAFESAATDLVPDDGNGKIDVFVHDRRLGLTERVSLAPPPLEADGDSRFAGISANGRYVAFHSAAANLVPEDGNLQADVFVHDRKKRTTTRVSVASDGTEGDRGSFVPVISANGRVVVFESSAENLAPGDGNESTDVFAHDRRSGVTRRLSVDAAGTETGGGGALPVVSADGRVAAFESSAAQLVSEDTNELLDVFVHDRRRVASK